MQDQTEPSASDANDQSVHQPADQPDPKQVVLSCSKCLYNITDLDPSGYCPECGTTILDKCICCGYDLSGTDAKSPCPECGTPAMSSVGFGPLQFESPERIESLRAGMRAVTVSILLYIVFFVIVLFGAFYVAMFLALIKSDIERYVLQVVSGVVSAAIPLVFLWGWWRIARPFDSIQSPLDQRSKRTALTVTVRISVVLYALSLVMAFVPVDPNSGDFILIGLVGAVLQIALYAANIACFIAQMRYFRWIARLSRMRKMERRAKHFIWSGPLIFIIGFLIFFLGPLIAIVLYRNMIHYVSKDLKKYLAARAAAAAA